MRCKFSCHSMIKLILIVLFFAAGQALADDSPRHRLIDGINIYTGVLPAEVMGGNDKGMHAVIPYEHSFHLITALFDEKSGDRISDAVIVASLKGMDVIETKKLGQMPTVGVSTYGNYFMLPPLGNYSITLQITIPDREAIITRFPLEFLEEEIREGSIKNGMEYDYGLWLMVVINSAIILIFTFSFYRPKTKRDWRSFGAFSAFVIALFTEMYGFPLTIYLLSGWLTTNFPGVDIFSHHAGHLWWVVFGGESNPHADLFHILSNVLIVGGLILLSVAWRVLHMAQKNGCVADSGIYSHIRHPQYVGFIIIMIGFLLQWPTLPTLVMFPILVWMYVRLAQREEQESLRLFGDAYREYAKAVPGFIPRLSRQGGKPWKG